MALDQYLSVPILITTVTFFITYWIVQLWNKNRKLPPGPWGLPFFGYYPFISPNEPYKDLTKLSKKYGSIYSFRTFGGRLVIVLNGTKTVKDVIVNRAEEFIGRPHGDTTLTWVSDVGILQDEGEAWKEQRKFFLQTAKSLGFGKLEMEGKIHDEIKGMLEDLRKDCKNGQDVDLQSHGAYVTNSIISQILFGKRFTKDEFHRKMEKEFLDCVKVFVGKKHILIGNILKLFLTFSPSMRRANKARGVLQKCVSEIVKEHLTRFDPTHPKDYVDYFLLQRTELLKNGSEGSFTVERLEANCLNLFMEGTETVSFTANHLLEELSKYPETQKKIQQELDSIVGKERLPSWADRIKLPLLEATIQELYRMATPFNLSTMYSNFKQTTIEGYTIPERSSIIFNLDPGNFDNGIFPNPHKFDPSRFLSADGKKMKQDGPFPFGIGKRACAGESLAHMEVFLIIASVVQNFTVYPGSEQERLKLVPRNL
ncbi:Cytochrome P450 2F3 like protein [Argiope bruennichi]|uniref:Cytochrome P450 2F3 like protein n=1 Tax=Argiope bruennichi TaxID=94029 RepID=A0A8T0FEJ1_ARGBR|nr:Cytochrome P450 2F3 like protein [Argiope bruennichi]